ncbi:hypothetical protein B0T21DRAFT_445012 [Apiosordaria backusii]|uniref:Uncharacterized protein n=1 Tax=Apiosordaria backusii TaxID=314023 RepID=A0AA40B7Q1_9PEZI|nr:hypothetical protein B0T21DRAFT_445012 [Apiosordaria backusii]
MAAPPPVPRPAQPTMAPTQFPVPNTPTLISTQMRPAGVIGAQSLGRPILQARRSRPHDSPSRMTPPIGNAVLDSITVAGPEEPARLQGNVPLDVPRGTVCPSMIASHLPSGLLSRRSQLLNQMETRPSSAKISNSISTKRKHQEMSDDTPPLTSQSASPASIIGAPDTPENGIASRLDVAPLPSPRQTPQQQTQNAAQISMRSTGPQLETGIFKKCKRCKGLFDWPSPPRGKTVPNSVAGSRWNERTNMYCGRCYMRLYVCEAMFDKNEIRREYREYEQRVETYERKPESIKKRIEFLDIRLASIGRNLVNAAALNPKLQDLLEKDAENEGDWARIIGHLDRQVSGRPTDETVRKFLGKKWRDEIMKWINMLATMLVRVFFEEQGNLDYRCGGYCGYCKPELEERKALRAMQRAILRGDKELPGQPLSVTRLFQYHPKNPDGTYPPQPFISNIDGRGDLMSARVERSPPSWTESAAVNLKWDEWVVDYDKYKPFEEVFQDNLDKLNALDKES